MEKKSLIKKMSIPEARRSPGWNFLNKENQRGEKEICEKKINPEDWTESKTET